MDRRILLLLGGLSTGVIVAAASACSDDVTDPARPAEDGGADAPQVTPDDSATGDDASPDSGSSGDGPRIFFASDLTSIDNAVRICLLSSTTTDEPQLADVLDAPPFPATGAGLHAGELARLDVPGGKLAGRSFRVAAFYVPSLESFGMSSKSCSEIVKEVRDPEAGTGTLIDGADFEIAQPLPRTFFRDDRTYVVLATGCLRATPLDYAYGECPGGTHVGEDGGYDGKTSYFRTIAYELDPTPASTPGKNRAQFIFGSTGTLRKAIDVNEIPGVMIPGVRYADPAADGGFRTEPIVGAAYDGGAQPFLEDSGVLVPAPGTEVTDLKTMDSFEYNYISEGSPPRLRPVSEIDALSGGFKVADVKDGKAYTFLFFGTPWLPPTYDDGGIIPAYYHVVLLPND